MEKLIFWMKKVNALFSFVGSSNAKENVLLDPHFWSEIDTFDEVQSVTDAIEQGANIHAYDKNRKTPLHFAAERSITPKVVALLLDKGADIEARCKYGQTVLYAAIGNLYVYEDFGKKVHVSRGMLELLLDRGANIQDCDIKKRTPLHIAALCSESGAVVKLLLDRGANCLAKDIDGKTPYDYAQKNRSPAKDFIGWQVYEAQKQQEPIDPEYQKELDYEREHKLVDEEFLGYASADDVIRAINDGADIEATGRGEMTPLLLTLNNNMPGFPLLFLDYGADINVSDEEGVTPLHLATRYTNEPFQDVIDLFLEYGADVYALDNSGYTPLHWASGSHSSEIKDIKRMLEEGADINARGNDDRTHLHFAAEGNLPEVVAFFLDKGLDIEARTKQGQTPLHQAMCCIFNDTRLAVTELLLNRGANVEARDNFGRTPLHWAAIRTRYHSSAVVKLLLSRGANIESRTEKGQTPLHLAAKGSVDTRTIDALIAGGANATAQDKDGKTPFDYARENKYLKGSDAYWRLNDAHFNNEQQMVQRVAKVKRRRRIQPYLRLQKRRLGK